MTAARETPSLAVLTAMTALGTLALNLFLPSMPSAAAGLGTDFATVQLTLSLYLVGWAVGQPVWGPLSDRYGRRPALLWGIAVYVAGSLLCAGAWSVEALIAGRVGQALGASAGFVLSAAIVQDAHGRDGAAGVLAWITVAMALVPAAVPILGGVLDEHVGWRAGFLLVAATGAAALVACRATVGETRPVPGGAAGRARPGAALALLRSPAYCGYTLNFAMTNAAYYGFLAAAPYLMIEVLDRSPAAYGLWFALIPGGYLLGSLAAARLSARAGIDTMVLAGTGIALAGGVATLALHASLPLSPAILFVPMAAAMVGNGISHPSAVAGAVSADPESAGAAAGLKGFVQMITGAATSALVARVQGESATAALLLIVAALALAVAGLAIARGLPMRRAPRPAPAASA